MPACTVCQRYSAYSDGHAYGPWEAGTVVDLDEDEVAFVERDAPGTLLLVATVPAEAEPVSEPEMPKAPRGRRPAKGA